MTWQGVEMEIQVPCAQGKRHPVRLRFTGWGKYEVAHNPCEELLGAVFARMAPCTHYLREQFPEVFRQDARFRKQLVEALGAVGTPAVPLLIQALGDWDEDVRRAAAEALGAIGDPRAVPPLIKALGDYGEYWYDVRRAAAEALGKLSDPQAIPALSVWAHAGEDTARDTLQTLGHPMLDLPQAVAQVAAQGAWGVLIRALTCTQVREVVVGLGAPAVPALIRTLEDSEWRVRYAACWALDAIGDASAESAPIQALRNSEKEVRKAACAALGQIGDVSAVPALIQALRDSEWDVRRAAREALVKIGVPAVPALIQALGDSYSSVRAAACEVMGTIGDAQAVPALTKALGDLSFKVQGAARNAIKQIEARQSCRGQQQSAP